MHLKISFFMYRDKRRYFSFVIAISPTTMSFDSTDMVSDRSFLFGSTTIRSICAAPPGISRPYTPLMDRVLPKSLLTSPVPRHNLMGRGEAVENARLSTK